MKAINNSLFITTVMLLSACVGVPENPKVKTNDSKVSELSSKDQISEAKNPSFGNLKNYYVEKSQKRKILDTTNYSKLLEQFDFCDNLYSVDERKIGCVTTFISIYDNNQKSLRRAAEYGAGGITCDGRWSSYANRDRDGDGIECEWEDRNHPSSTYTGGSTYVRGYYRKDGTYVRGHTRRTR